MDYQDYGQLEERYGDATARTILSNCATGTGSTRRN